MSLTPTRPSPTNLSFSEIVHYDAPMRTSRQGGRPSKGPRTVRTVRVTPTMNDRIIADAEAQGLTMSDVIANVLADHYKLPHAASPTRRTDEHQDQLAV